MRKKNMYKYCFQNFPVAETKEKKSKTKLAKIFENFFLQKIKFL